MCKVFAKIIYYGVNCHIDIILFCFNGPLLPSPEYMYEWDAVVGEILPTIDLHIGSTNWGRKNRCWQKTIQTRELVLGGKILKESQFPHLNPLASIPPK